MSMLTETKSVAIFAVLCFLATTAVVTVIVPWLPPKDCGARVGRYQALSIPKGATLFSTPVLDTCTGQIALMMVEDRPDGSGKDRTQANFNPVTGVVGPPLPINQK